MQSGRRYTLRQTLNWGRRFILLFLLYDTVPVVLYKVLDLGWLSLPWQPISLIGIAVAFYLGFKNNSSYERMWEARKIWGGIVNTSRSFAVMARDFIHNEGTHAQATDEELASIRKRLVHRHVAWLHALTIQLRKVKDWEHNRSNDNFFRDNYGTQFDKQQFEKLKPYLSNEDYEYVMGKGNQASHLLSLQNKDLMALRLNGPLEHFRHLQMQELITECYTLQGKSERIKNFPFPRQYATVNFFFTVLFVGLLPLGMLNVFAGADISWLIWLSIPFSVIGSWVFWTMHMIGDYSENPFEGLYNDVPISSMAVGIEIDIRQMLDETDLPEPIQPIGEFKMLL
ncbi:MAG TPA: multidrug transporter [Cytophagales bacterium]|nr:multidrug transporter [Cytophagales bacterium]HAP59913.1 multidrug transporter [Cytophagales bacterium]